MSTKRKILFSFICLTLLLLAAELAVRVRAWLKYGEFQPDRQLVYDAAADIYIPRPGLEVKGRNRSIKVNSLGFRGEEFTPAKPRGTIRLACVGASTTYCGEVSSEEATWPQQLQNKLQKKYPDVSWQVINAGVPGHRMADCLKNLRHRVLPLQPDLVIFYEANNQMAYDTLRLAREQGLVDTKAERISPPVKFLSQVSLLFDLCYKNLTIAGADKGDSAKKLSGLPDSLPDEFIKRLAEFHAELKKQKIPLLLSAFVVKYRPDQERAVQIANADVAFYYMPWMTLEDLLAGIHLYNDAIIRYARSHGVPVVEEVTSIPPDAKHFVDCMHLSDAGCERMADRFLKRLEESNLISSLLDRQKKSLQTKHLIEQ